MTKNPEKDAIFAKKKEKAPLLTKLLYHMNKRILSVFALSAAFLTVCAQQDKGGISPEMLNQIKQSYQGTTTDKAIRNAIGNNDIRKLALVIKDGRAYYPAEIHEALGITPFAPALKVQPAR